MKRAAPLGPLTLITAMLATHGACAQPLPANGLYRSGGILRQPHAGAVPVRRGPRHEWAVLGAPVTTTRATLVSENNQNSRYQLFVEYPLGRCAEAALVLDGTVYLSEGYGSGPNRCNAGFELDQGVATAAAQLLHLTRQDRHPVAEAVTGRFAYHAGPDEVVLTLRNPADASPVQRRQGGHDRGPRDNQFAFSLTRNGHPVPPVEGPDFGGLMALSAMPPGSSVRLGAPLAAWGDVSARGHYVVECRYETEFAPVGARLSEDTQRGAVWDRTFTGRVEFDVR